MRTAAESTRRVVAEETRISAVEARVPLALERSRRRRGGDSDRGGGRHCGRSSSLRPARHRLTLHHLNGIDVDDDARPAAEPIAKRHQRKERCSQRRALLCAKQELKPIATAKPG